MKPAALLSFLATFGIACAAVIPEAAKAERVEIEGRATDNTDTFVGTGYKRTTDSTDTFIGTGYKKSTDDTDTYGGPPWKREAQAETDTFSNTGYKRQQEDTYTGPGWKR